MLVYKFIKYKFLFQIIHNYKLQVILLDLDLMIPLRFTSQKYLLDMYVI